VPVVADPNDEMAPALASSGDCRLLLVYEYHEDNGRVLLVGRLLETR
jgi:hypothetical protein